MPLQREALEAQLNDFDPAVRNQALRGLLALVQDGAVQFPTPGRDVNLHCHTFFSYNGYGHSPIGLAWRARCAGLAVAGVVDFDVLDAVDEFLEACRLVGLRGCAGIETRVYVPEFGTREINSPGEPGISYHMGAGFPSTQSGDAAFVDRLRDIARNRNLSVLARVNPYLSPVELDYDRDVLPLTPSGNATERHVCLAYDRKAQHLFPDEAQRTQFWAEKLQLDPNAIRAAFNEPPVFQGMIRSKLMKAGGVGYVKPEGPDFPSLRSVNEFTRAAGAIPVITWLNGLSEGEQSVEELFDLMVETGGAALNIVPDRNWNIADPGDKQRKVAKLHEIVQVARVRDLPVIVGTEMNAYGQRFVDDFTAPDMAPLVEPALEGGYLMYAHTALQAHAAMGYLSPWAAGAFATTAMKNTFFVEMGRRLEPDGWAALDGVTPASHPSDILARLKD